MSPDSLVYCRSTEHWHSALLSGVSVKAVKTRKSSLQRVEVIAASGDLTMLSSNSSLPVEFWKGDCFILKAVYDGDVVRKLSRSRSWFLVERDCSVVFYSIPNLDVTRVI